MPVKFSTRRLITLLPDDDDALLDLAVEDAGKLGTHPNYSYTVRELIRAETKRRKKSKKSQNTT